MTPTSSTGNDYFKDIAEVLFQYRLSGFLCDTVLLTSNGELRAHSALLAAASPVFKAAMETDLLRNVHYVRVTELDVETVEVALSIMYTGRLVVPVAYSTTDRIHRLLEALYQLGIERSTLANCQIELSRNAQTDLTSELLLDLLATNHLKKDACKTSRSSVVVIQVEETRNDKEICSTESENCLNTRRKRKANRNEKNDEIHCRPERKLLKVQSKKETVREEETVREDVNEKLKRRKSRVKMRVSKKDLNVADCPETDNSSLLIIKPEINIDLDNNFETKNDNFASSDTDDYSNDINVSCLNADATCQRLLNEHVPFDKISLRSNRTKSSSDRDERNLRKIKKRDIARPKVKKKHLVNAICTEKIETNGFERERENLNLMSDTNNKLKFDDTLTDNHSSPNALEHASLRIVEPPTSINQESITYKIKTEEGEATTSDDKPYSCHVCGFVSKYRSNMTKHIRRHDGPTLVDRKFQCALCSKAFGKASHLVKHVRTHTGERPHKCSVCDRTFAERANMERHALMHSAIKPHLCELCGKGFIRKSFLADHVATHHATKQTAQDCAKCGLTFTRRLSFVRHCLKVHGSLDAVFSGQPDETGVESSGVGDREQDTTGHQPMICDVCGKTFITLTTLKSHARVHANHAALTCKMCGRTYSSLTNLRLHERSVHSTDKPHACTVCDKVFALKIQLNLHMVRHAGTKNYQCDVCLKEFVLQSSLQSHVKIHTTEKKFGCHVCNKSFKFQNTLTAHIRIHTGEKPFKCTHCAMAFKQNVHLTRHIRSHTGEKPYACEMCSRAYKNKIDLGYHYTRFHQVNRT